jgi:uncharacterized membrane protein YgaE (UPF0421/DUF939 family)
LGNGLSYWFGRRYHREKKVSATMSAVVAMMNTDRQSAR